MFSGSPRDFYLKKLKEYLRSNHVIVITGARRSGKSFIMRQLAQELIRESISRNAILMVNFEDPRFQDLDEETLEQIYETYIEIQNPREKPFLFLDEIQEVRNWEKWVRTAHELGRAKIVISGSNAHLLSRELGTLLTGRHIDLTVYPLSFRELISFNNIALHDATDLIAKEREIKRLLKEYIEFGAFPEIAFTHTRREILFACFDDIINKDLVQRYRIRKIPELKSLSRYYMSNIASLVTYNRLGKFLKISADTIEKFSSYLESSFLVLFLKKFSSKVKEREKSPRKVYCIDTGLSNAIGFHFSENLGHAFENIVLLELLRKKTQSPGIEIYYWKDERQREVDFLLMEGSEIREAIQVCSNLDHPAVCEREVKSLKACLGKLGLREGTIVTGETEKRIEEGGTVITAVPLHRWLLEGRGYQ